MNFLKIFMPEELDEEEQKKRSKERQRSLDAKNDASDSISRFEHSLLELETILKKSKEKRKHG